MSCAPIPLYCCRGSTPFSLMPAFSFSFVPQSIHKHLRVTCAASCMILAPLLPLPVETTAGLAYVEALMKMTERLPPILLVHAKKNVIYTDL